LLDVKDVGACSTFFGLQPLAATAMASGKAFKK
jgi:hypothetical protein